MSPFIFGNCNGHFFDILNFFLTFYRPNPVNQENNFSSIIKLIINASENAAKIYKMLGWLLKGFITDIK